jgi:hypothetical protein
MLRLWENNGYIFHHCVVCSFIYGFWLSLWSLQTLLSKVIELLTISSANIWNFRVCRSWSTSGTRRVNIVTNPIISREWVNDREVLTISGKYRWSLWTRHYDKRDDFNFPIVNFPFIRSNIPAASAYRAYISQLIQYSRACGSHQDFDKAWNYLVKWHHLYSGTWN